MPPADPPAETHPELVPSTVAARRYGIAARTLTRYARDGVLVPAAYTPGGHYRWDIEDLGRQLTELRRKAREEEDRR